MSLFPTSIYKPPASHPQHRSDKEFGDFLTVVDHITKTKPSSKGKHRSSNSSCKFNPVVYLPFLSRDVFLIATFFLPPVRNNANALLKFTSSPASLHLQLLYPSLQGIYLSSQVPYWLNGFGLTNFLHYKPPHLFIRLGRLAEQCR